MKRFRARIHQSIVNQNLQVALDNNAQRRKDGRISAFASLPDHQEHRRRAHTIKADVVAHLDEYLIQFIEKVTANGIIVHRAADGKEAVSIFLEIAEKQKAKNKYQPPSIKSNDEILVAKSKSMVSEEINFNHAVEAAGMRVVETDLGEYIVQLRGEHPSHIITPAVHLQRGDVGKLFEEKLGLPYTEDIPVLTKTARRVLRDVFLNADIGVSGVNFGVVESGTLALVTNEGNGRMCTTIPPVHVALMGIERLVPTMDDLALFLSLLPRSATGQKLSVYTSLIHSPRHPIDPDGPLERHLILVDNGRSALSTSPLAEALYCIRCGACLNACPVFRELSGHAYLGRDGTVAPYPGPIGSVVSPGLLGCENFGHLAQASTLCGACKEACPVDIDLPGLLLRVRAGETPEAKHKQTYEGVGIPTLVKLGLKGFRLAAAISRGFTLFQVLGGLFSRIYSPRDRYMRIPAWTRWGYSKDFPRLVVHPFHKHWKNIQQEINEKPCKSSIEPAPPRQALPVKSLKQQFIDELSALGGIIHHLPEKDVPARVAELLRSKGIPRVFVDACGDKYVTGVSMIREPDPTIRAGVTGALCGIAETGSLVLTGGEGRPLTASLLPEIHIAILKAFNILPTLAEALARPEIREAAAGVIITGPSRTADIEMTLTIGVHGPGELHVFLIDDSETV